MYPNPQEALPLTPRPNLEHYRKLAKDLVKVCRSGNGTAIRGWAIRWIDRLSTLSTGPRRSKKRTDIEASAGRVEEFARKQFSGGKCSLVDGAVRRRARAWFRELAEVRESSEITPR